MSTTIDSLAIEIQSNSSGAIGEIERLAEALEKIKKSTVTKTAVNNLKSLTTALKELTPVSSNANKLGSLAESIKKLSTAGSIRGITNQLKELPSALRGLSDVNLDGVAPKLESVAAALGPLTNVKGKGFNDAMSGLSKLGEVTKKLDNATINSFVAKIKELDEKLGPVSTKLIAVGRAIKDVNTTAKTASSNVGNLGNKVNATALNMSSLVTVAQSVVTALRPIITLLSNSIGLALEWDGVNYQFGNAFGEQAEEYYEEITRITEALKLNKQTFMENSAMATSMLKGFGVGSEDARKMGLGYTELAYDIWAVYNNVYKSFDGADGAMAAVRSAIAGEVEPIRRAGFTIVDSQLKITAANHGIAYSSEKATEAQKSYLRYLTLVDQAHTKGIVGGYAHEMNTAEGQVRTFTQQLKSLSQTFGSVFLPVLVKTMPYIQAFVELLGEAIRAVAGFFGVEIQKVDFGSNGFNDLSADANGANEEIQKAEQSLKDLKNATLGFDELNVISPPSGSGSDSGAGYEDLDIESLWDESIFDNIQSEVDKIKENLKDWIPVIEAVGVSLGLLGAAKLLSDLTNALGKMDTLSKAIFGIGTALIEASLVFVFADNYLEEGNLLSLVGEGITTAMGSYLLYKTWGAKGLVVGLAVSIAAQLMAITLNIADGSVQMDDPQLWIQSAFTTALGGAAGGWMAYKGLVKLPSGAAMGVGKGIGIGVLAVASLSLAAITIGEITANGDVTTASIWTGISSIVAAAGFGFTVGGAWGAVIGAGVALAINVVGAMIGVVSKDAEKSIKEDLEGRFGKVKLSVSKINVIIGQLVPEWAAGVNQAKELYKGVESLINSIETQEGSLGGYEWKISVGLVLTESESQAYRTAIDTFVAKCQDYVAKRGYALEIGLKATTSNSQILESANSITSQASKELENLGKQLQETVNAAYEDGLLDIDELEAIQNIRNDMREIVNALNSSEIDATFDMLKMNWSGVELTPESFESMMTEWNNTIQNDIKPALEATVKENLKTLKGNVAYLELALEKDPNNETLKADLEKAKQAYQDYIDENPLENLTLEANVEAVTFVHNTIKDAFAAEINRVEKEGYLSFADKLKLSLTVFPDVKFDEGSGDVYGNIQALIAQIQYEMKGAGTSLSKEARNSLEAMLESMKPTVADFENIATENRKAGVTVTQSIRDGLNDHNELLALSGDLDGINYMIGQGFTTDPVYLNTLATMEGAGTQLTGAMREGFLNNVDYVYDDATGLIIGIRDAVNNKVISLTPEMEKSLSDLGVDLGDALGNRYSYVYDETTGVVTGIKDAVNDTTISVASEVEKAMSDLGVDMSNGVIKGAEEGMNADKKSWTDWAIWPWKWFKEKNEIKSPSKLFERGGKYLTDGLKNGMETNSLRDKLSTIWATAKSWWNNKDGLASYTPSIGNITSALSSAWASAKEWWNNNVRLSIPSLSFKVTYSTEGLGTVKKAIVNALGLQGWPKLSFAASGGIFDMGSLVWAGESGPEIVANAGGGKTGVMNVQQMSDAVYEGVYSAVVAAMRASGNGENTQAVNVYLDGKQITATVEKHQKSRGATLMTGGMAYGY